MEFLALTTRGLEKIVEEEIYLKLSDPVVRDISYRKVLFTYDGSVDDIVRLRSVEDMFIHIGTIENVGYTRLDLNDLIAKILELDFSESFSTLQNIRPLKTFSISASSVGKRNFSTIDLKERIYKPLQSKLKVEFEDELHEGFDLRIFLEHDKAYIGARILAKPLHRREYKQTTTQASLKGNIAYAMAFISGIKHSDIVLDPMCGSGTILIEAAEFKPLKLLGGDNNEDAIAATKSNADLAKTEFEVKLWDARKLPFDNHSIDKIIVNLPFDKQIQINGNSIEFYTELCLEFKRVLKESGTLIAMTSLQNEIKQAFEQTDLTVTNNIEISLHGEIVTIFSVTI